MFKTSNNKAKYKELLVGMQLCLVLEAGHLKAFFNSQVVVS